MKREWLKAARKEKNLTLVQLGQLAECSFNYISDLEHGRRTPSLKTAFKLERILGISIQQFQEGEEIA